VTPLIREAEPCEAVTIARVINEAYQVEAFFKVGDRTSAPEIAAFLRSETFLVAADSDGTAVGAVRVSVTGPRGHFGMLAVANEWKGTGLGRRLVEAAEAFAVGRGCDSMDLEVASPRTELPAFYRKFGYELTGTAPWPERALHELKQPAHFLVMSKPLLVSSHQEELVGH
jgi:ribosomal protein S18 acetylase RimI-like enzyme